MTATGTELAIRDTSGASLRNWQAEAEAAAGLARSIAGTAFVPGSLRVMKDGQLDYDATIATVTAALLAGQELGLGPMAALRSIDVVRGTPALRAVALRALLLQRGHHIAVVESTATRAVVRARRAGSPEVQQSTWTIDRARQLGIAPGPRDGPWQRQPQAMLVARATAESARWVAADAILGLPLISEELETADQEDTAAAALAAAEPAAAEQPKRTARRRRQPQAPALPSGPPVPEQPPPQPAAQPAAEPAASRAQLSALHAALRDAGLTNRDRALAEIAGWIEHAIESTSQLTPDECSRAIDRARQIAQITPPPEDQSHEEPDQP